MNVRTDETSLMTSLIKVMIRVNIYITFLIKIVDINVKKVVARGQAAKFLKTGYKGATITILIESVVGSGAACPGISEIAPVLGSVA